ncbi:MAG: hypothetical protein M1522_01175, partial [Actinobacteria bacterium]|nr:hypothetical protein [Actinomycetota bacterium]
RRFTIPTLGIPSLGMATAPCDHVPPPHHRTHRAPRSSATIGARKITLDAVETDVNCSSAKRLM